MRDTDRLRDPRDALTKLMECLMIAFAYSRKRGSFVLVCDFPDKAPSADRAFAAFVFDGVRDFSREAGDLPELRRFEESFEAQWSEGGVVIQAIGPGNLREGGQIELWFGPNFGGLQFAYDSVVGYVRNGIAENVDGDWLYRDAVSGEEFDFHDPFPGLLIDASC